MAYVAKRFSLSYIDHLSKNPDIHVFKETMNTENKTFRRRCRRYQDKLILKTLLKTNDFYGRYGLLNVVCTCDLMCVK